MLDNLQKVLRLSVTMLMLLLISACASNVVVKGKVPTPLVEKIPLSGKLVYSDEFKSYTYNEAEKGRALTSLNFGQAQVDLFNDVFNAVLVNSNEQNDAADLIIEPEIIDFQYTVPRETKLKLYEIWLKYRLKISNSSNQQLADWVVKGYGKTPTGTLTSASSAFNAAANVALRDVGAQLSIGFARQPNIKAMLGGGASTAQRSQESSLEETALDKTASDKKEDQ